MSDREQALVILLAAAAVAFNFMSYRVGYHDGWYKGWRQGMTDADKEKDE